MRITMLKRPYDFIIDYYRDKINRDRKNNEFIYSQTDTLVAWIIGFAFTGLMLLIGKIKSLDLALSNPTKPIIICILVTIILGLAFRYVSFLIVLFEKGLDDYYFGRFGEHEFTPIEVDEEIETADFEKMVIRLKEDFDKSISYNVPLTEELKAIELPQLKEHYKKLCEHSKKSLDLVMKHIAEIEFTTHRIDIRKNLDLFNKALNNPKTGYNAKNWSFARSLLFTLCLLAFLTGISIVCFSLLFMR